MKAKVINVFLFCALLSLILAVLFWENFVNALGSDLVSFLTGAKIIREGLGENLYSLTYQYKIQKEIVTPHWENFLLPFRNLPLFALFFVPLTFLPLLTSYKIYTLFLVFMTLFISRFSLKVFKNLKGSFWFVLPFIFYPSFGSIFAGQVSIMLLLLFLLIYFHLKKDNPFRVGLLSGLLLLKIQYTVAIPLLFFLIKSKKDFFRGFFISTLIVVLGSVLISGPALFEDYPRMVVTTQNTTFGTKDTNMFTLYSGLSQITLLPKSEIFLANLVLYLLAVIIFFVNYKRLRLDINFAILTLLTLIFSVHGVNHDLAILVLPIWLLVNRLKDKNKSGTLLVLAIFTLILSPLTSVLKISYFTSFLFLFSVALLLWFQENPERSRRGELNPEL